MKGRIIAFICSVFVFLPLQTTASALTPVISSLKTGETGSASKEYVSIYNNSSDSIDVTDWCIQYASSTDATKTKLACVKSPDKNTKLYLSSHGYINFASNEFVASITGFSPDFTFSAGISGTSGHLRLIDSLGNEIDKIGWGSAASPEGSAVQVHKSGYVLQRKTSDLNLLQDTNNNLNDFVDALLIEIPSSGLEEVVVPIDVCSNIDGLQTDMPEGYLYDTNNLCKQDICANLDGLQENVPADYESLDGESCIKKIVVLETSVIKITELLPNVTSTDTGNEFIELYNPNDHQVDLSGYKLDLNSASPKSYTFSSQIINPFSFVSFNDTFTKLTLPNTSASLSLTAPAGNVVDTTDIYANPGDDESWAYINNQWQYTNQPTPGAENKSSLADNEIVGDQEIQPCAEGKYRNPETGRCRNIATLVSELLPCSEGQERNPSTNRCRNVASSSSLVPCKEGQERNPDTNRCRSIVTASAQLTACKEGEERNPATNRCRKVDQAVKGVATAKVNDVPSSILTPKNWMIYGTIGGGILAYGAYEWRQEILRAFMRFKR